MSRGSSADSELSRYDYENVEAGGANLLMTFLEAQLTGYIGKDLTANGTTYRVSHADNFQYKDPIDGSVTTKQAPPLPPPKNDTSRVFV